MNKPRYEVCARCGKAWRVSVLLPTRRKNEIYVCPICARHGEKTPFLRRK